MFCYPEHAVNAFYVRDIHNQKKRSRRYMFGCCNKSIPTCNSQIHNTTAFLNNELCTYIFVTIAISLLLHSIIILFHVLRLFNAIQKILVTNRAAKQNIRIAHDFVNVAPFVRGGRHANTCNFMHTRLKCIRYVVTRPRNFFYEPF